MMNASIFERLSDASLIMRYLLTFVSVLSLGQVAFADKPIEVGSRNPLSSSMPCAGKLYETDFDYQRPRHHEGMSRKLVLSCLIDKGAKWVIQAEVFCNKNDPQGLTKNFCESGLGTPYANFVHVSLDGRERSYDLGRFVFAHDCVTLEVNPTYIDPVTGRTTPLELGPFQAWQCGEISSYDGLGVTGSKVKAADWKYLHLKTSGDPIQEDPEIMESGVKSIVGAEPYMYQFKIEMHDGDVYWGEP